LTANYGEGLNVEWTEFEYNKIAEIKARHKQGLGQQYKKTGSKIRAILRLADSGLSIEQIMRLLHVGKKKVLGAMKPQDERFNQPTYVAHYYFASRGISHSSRRNHVAAYF